MPEDSFVNQGGVSNATMEDIEQLREEFGGAPISVVAEMTIEPGEYVTTDEDVYVDLGLPPDTAAMGGYYQVDPDLDQSDYGFPGAVDVLDNGPLVEDGRQYVAVFDSDKYYIYLTVAAAGGRRDDEDPRDPPVLYEDEVDSSSRFD